MFYMVRMTEPAKSTIISKYNGKFRVPRVFDKYISMCLCSYVVHSPD